MVDGQKSIFFLLFLVLSTVLLSTPRITIQVNQPGNLILTAEIDSVWVGNDYRIHTSPKLKSWIRPGYVTLPYFSETLVGVPSTAQIIWFPSEERHISVSHQLTNAISEAPKGMNLSSNDVPQPMVHESGDIVELVSHPSIKGNQCSVLKIYPISHSDGILTWIKQITIQFSFPPEPTTSQTTILSDKGGQNLISKYPMFRATNQLPDYHWSENLVKIIVDSTQWYRITKSDLEENGVNFQNVNPQFFQLWNENEEIMMFIEGEQDGIFNYTDQIIFKGHNNSVPKNAPYSTNFYSGENVYWLTWGDNYGLRYSQKNAHPSVELPDWKKPIYFTQKVHFEKNEHFARLGQVEDKLHHRWDSFDHFFMNPPVNSGTSVDFMIEMDYPATNTFQLTAEIQGITSSTHIISMQWNDHLIGESQSWNGQSTHQLWGESGEINPIPILNGLNVFSIINLESPHENSSYDQVYLNWVDVTYDRFFLTDREFIQFTIGENNSGLMEFTVRGFDSESIYIFKEGVSNLNGFLIIEDEMTQTYSARFQDEIVYSGTEYHVFSELVLDTVKQIIPMVPMSSPLGEIASEYIVIAPDSFHTSLQPLVEFHGGLLIDIDEIYRQYSHGKLSPYGIKNYLRDIYLNHNGMLKAVLIGMQGENINKDATGFDNSSAFIPSMKIQTVGWGAASSDFWYSCVEGDDLIPEFSIGRFPVSNTRELENMVEKTMSYHLQEDKFWHNNQLLIAGYEPEFKIQSELLMGNLVQNGFFPKRLYIDVTSETGPYFGGSETLLAHLTSGLSYVNFLGHGGGAVWGDRSLLTLDALDHLYNSNKLPFVTSMTCFTGDVTNPNALGRRMVTQENSGAVAWFGSSGVGWIQNDFLLLEPIHQYLFSGDELSLGDIINNGKIEFISSNTSYPDIAKTQVYQFNLSGDPMLKLKKNGNGNFQISPDIVPFDQEKNIELTQGMNDSVYYQIFDSENHPIHLDPHVYQESFLLSDSMNSGLYHINLSAKSGTKITHGSKPLILIGGTPILQIVSIEPNMITYKDSLLVDCIIAGVQSTDSVFLNINGAPYKHISFDSMTDQSILVKVLPQNPNQTITVSLEVKEDSGSIIQGDIEQVDIMPLADFRPNSLEFVTTDSVQLKAEIENLYPSLGYSTVIIDRKSESGNWDSIGIFPLSFNGKEKKGMYIPVSIPRGVFEYRVISASEDSTVTHVNDTLLTSMETQAFFGLENDSIGVRNVDVFIQNGSGLVEFEVLNQVNLSLQPEFQIQIVDTLRDAIRLLTPEEMEYELTWRMMSEIEDSLSLHRYYESFNTWLPIPFTISDGYATFTDKGPIQVAFLNSTDETPPRLEAALNGQKFFQDSYVSSNPLIHITATDENGLDHRQSGMKVWLNEMDSINVDQISGNGNELSIQIRPRLTSMDSSIKVLISDARGNWSDTLHLTFLVKSELELIDYGNYPNPFETRTWFAYELTDECDNFYLDIFTVTGKRIRRFTTGSTDRNLESGSYHEIMWDGRDEWGELVGNGVYFYRMVGYKNDITLEQIGKIAKAR